MSRRHKEKETDIIKPQQAESHADGRQKEIWVRHFGSIKEEYTIIKCGANRFISSMRLIIPELPEALSMASERNEIEVDKKWVKIPRKYFKFEGCDQEERKKSKGGRNPIKRLFKKIADSKVVEYYHNALEVIKEKCIELYENTVQYAVCFFKAAFKAFSPEEDPYGKISHYHRILEHEVPDLPTRKTLSNWYKWFEDWKQVVFNESHREKAERARHSLWERLIDKIRLYLKDLAPQYALA